MNKVITIILSIIVIASAVFVGVYFYGKGEKTGQNTNQVQNETEISEEILDECTDEWEQLQEDAKMEILQANSSEEKISPNCDFILKKYYKKCEHTTQEYSQIPENLVNKTEEQLKEIYQDWKVETFSANRIVLYKEIDDECGEHYILKEANGKIVVYQTGKNGEESEYLKTDVATEYLTETDKIHLNDGWNVYGKENLNQVIEDFE